MPKILVVDDEPKSLVVVAKFLKAAGFETYISSDAKKAVDVFRSFAPKVCLLDLSMPHEAAAILLDKEKNAAIEIVFIAAQREALWIQYRNGANSRLIKPAGLARLRSAINQAYDQRRSGKQSAA